MTNFISFFALLFCASLFIVSCSKVETPNVKSSASSVQQSSSNTTSGKVVKSVSGWSTNWLFDDDHVRCLPAALDCYDEIKVKPPQSDILTIFENAVNGNANDVKVFFTTQNWQLLFPDLEGTDNLIKLQSGNYDMIMEPDASNTVYYYAAGQQMPLTFENEEFVLRIDKSGLQN